MDKDVKIVNKKGFKFRRPGVSSTRPGTEQPSNGPVKLSKEFATVAKSSSATLQTSIASFARKPVAAVAPQGSPLVNRRVFPASALPAATCGKRAENILSASQPTYQRSSQSGFKNTALSENKRKRRLSSDSKDVGCVTIDDDDDGFEDFISSQYSSVSKKASTHVASPKFKRARSSTGLQELSSNQINLKAKRDIITSNITSNQVSGISTQEKHIRQDSIKRVSGECNYLTNPVLKKSATEMTVEDATELKDVFVSVLDDICEIMLNKISSASLMSLSCEDYSKVQKLTSLRSEIKGKLQSIPHKTNTAKRSQKDSPRRSLAEKPGISPRKSQLTHITSTPMQVHSKDSIKCNSVQASPVLGRSPKKTKFTPGSRKFGSPIPCGDSFFGDDIPMTQSHMSFMNDIKRTSLGATASESNVLKHASSPVSSGSPNRGRTLPNPNISTVSLSSTSMKANTCALSPLPHPVMAKGGNLSAMSSGSAVSGSYNPNSSLSASSVRSSSNRNDESDTSFSRDDSTLDEEECLSALLASQVTEEEYDESTNKFDFDYKLSDSVCNKSSTSKKKKNVITDSGDEEDIAAIFGVSDFEEDFSDNDVVSTQQNQNKRPRNASNSLAVPYQPTFGGTDKDDGASGQFDGYHFPHSASMLDIFESTFGLKEFRLNQLQAINAALTGLDCFVLMPTGGGKSLCYQLPALVTDGVSIIVSPLKALIQDQVQRLLSLDIKASFLSSDIDQAEAQRVYSMLYMRKPEIKLLYVTPEKLIASEKLTSCLQNLYGRHMLDRFVIDEAHCVSQWGHDFRPDYKKLNTLREKFAGVPMIALTATATPRVRRDIIHQLGMKSPKWFMQSFNRTNLKYEIKTKKKSTITQDIIKMIKEKFRNECGIVYCLSRKECDSVAADLKKASIKAEPYHAGLNNNLRANVQEKWLNDKCKVICATIAFGMGIDKPDVRFVIHYSLPKSVEGYYQESGRAGRDGRLARCLLFYSYQDVKRLRGIIEMDESATFESKKTHIDNLYQMIRYCENLVDCRRSQVLQYFGELYFDRERCGQFKGAHCDNCETKDSFQIRDVTEDAKEIVKGVKELTSGRGGNFTLIHFIDLFKGSQNSKIQSLGHDKNSLHGKGSSYERGDAERLMRKLVVDDILKEELKVTTQDHTACYLKLGKRAFELMQGKMKIELAIQGKKRNVETKVGKEANSEKQTLVEQCYNELLDMARDIVHEHGILNSASIFPNAMLYQMAEKVPTTIDEITTKVAGLPKNKITKYGADRFLDITTKYYALYESIQEEEETVTDVGRPEDWTSSYFNEPTTSRGKKGRFSGKATYKKKFKSRKSGKSTWKKKSTAKSSTPAKKKSASYSQFAYKKTASSASSSKSKSSFGGTGQKIGFMPAPQQRSFLSGPGHFFG